MALLKLFGNNSFGKDRPMDDFPKSDPLRFVERTVELASRAVAHCSPRFSKKRYTLRQHVVLLCLKLKKIKIDYVMPGNIEA